MWPVHWLYWNSCDIVVKRRQCYDKVTSSSDIVSQHIQELLLAYFEIENVVLNGEQERESMWDRKTVPRDHRLSSLGKPRDER